MTREQKVLIVSKSISKLHSIENTAEFQQHVRDLSDEALDYEYNMAKQLNIYNN